MAVLKEVARRRILTSLDDFGTHDGNTLKASVTLLRDIVSGRSIKRLVLLNDETQRMDVGVCTGQPDFQERQVHITSTECNLLTDRPGTKGLPAASLTCSSAR